MKSMEPARWGTTDLPADGSLRFRCGDLCFEVSAPDDEISFVSWREDEEGGERTEETLSRFVLPPGDRKLGIFPGMPALPVLVEPETPFHILPGAKARAYLKIPVSVIAKAGKDEWELGEFPTVRLSESWFGELDSGELCYWLTTGLSREPFEDLPRDLVQAPVHIHNAAAETLQVSRLCLRVNHLAIYEESAGLWASETRVKFQGGVKSSQIDIHQESPPETDDAVLIGEPREKGPATRVGRTFRSLRKWTSNLLDVE